MKSWKQILSCMAVFLTVLSLSVYAQAPQGDGKGGGMTPEERAALAKDSAPLTAKAIAQYVELKGDAEKKFTDAYVAELAEAQKRMADARQANTGDRQAMMDLGRQNEEKMKEVLAKNLTPEQAKKAEKVTGRGAGLERQIQTLLRNKVEKEKIEKALPTLVKFVEASQELMAKMQDNTLTREEFGPKMTELRDKTATELAPAIGEEAANKWKETRGFGGMRGGGQRPAQQ